MPIPRQLPPVASFLRILLNRLQNPSVHPKLNQSQPSSSYSLDRNLLILKNNNIALHQLRSHRSKNCPNIIQGMSHFAQRISPIRSIVARKKPI